MILVVGSSKDRVTPSLLHRLCERSVEFAFVDEDCAAQHKIGSDSSCGAEVFRFFGGNATGDRSVSAVFLRHAVARTLCGDVVHELERIQSAVNHALNVATCPVANLPTCAYSNYSKPFQLQLLREAGFAIPETLVTNCRKSANQFIESCEGNVVFKGVSNMTTFAQLLTAENRDRLEHLRLSPVQFQEYLPGKDYRVHVVGDRTFVCSLTSAGLDYRHEALIKDEDISVVPCSLPKELTDRCVAFMKYLGLFIGGFDFREDRRGVPRALELNPFPQFTFYESRSSLPIGDAVIDMLTEFKEGPSNIFA